MKACFQESFESFSTSFGYKVKLVSKLSDFFDIFKYIPWTPKKLLTYFASSRTSILIKYQTETVHISLYIPYPFSWYFIDEWAILNLRILRVERNLKFKDQTVQTVPVWGRTFWPSKPQTAHNMWYISLGRWNIVLNLKSGTCPTKHITNVSGHYKNDLEPWVIWIKR